jgi:enoyl-CoA hydratase
MDDGKANALSVPMIEALTAAIDRAEQEATAIVLAGRPERFCAGFDLRVMMSGPEAAKALLKQGADLLLKLFATPLPLVVACTGHALAGGALVALTADHRVGADGAFKLGLNEVAIGMPVPILAMELARARLVPTELTRATLLGQIYNPVEARAAGYLDEVVTAAEVLPSALATAGKLGQLSRTAFSATKVRLRGAVIEHIRSTFEEDVKRLLGV